MVLLGMKYNQVRGSRATGRPVGEECLLGS